MKKEELLQEIQRIIKLGSEALEHEVWKDSLLDGPSHIAFIASCKTLLRRHLSNHELYQNIYQKVDGDDNSTVKSIGEAIGYLKVIVKDDEYLNNFDEKEISEMNNKVFIVHGHDMGRRDEVEQLLRRIGLEPIILMNEPNRGLTLIEKIEQYTDVSYGIMLYSGCDQGKEKGSTKRYRLRARQNVIFEHGYLMSKLGRGNVAALVDAGVETPGDLSGLVYISLEDANWKNYLMKELIAAGFSFNATNAY